MKATGIVRRIDDFGRVVIPKEIRRTMALLMKLYGLLLLTVWRKRRMAKLLMKNGRSGMKNLIKITY